MGNAYIIKEIFQAQGSLHHRATTGRVHALDSDFWCMADRPSHQQLLRPGC